MNLKDEFIKLAKEVEIKKIIDDKTAGILKDGFDAVSSIDETKKVVGMHMGVGMNMGEGDPYKKDRDVIVSCISQLKGITENTMVESVMSQTIREIVKKSIALLVLGVDREVVFAEPCMVYYARPIFDFIDAREEVLRDYSDLTEDEIITISNLILSENELAIFTASEDEDRVLKNYGLSISQFKELNKKLNSYYSSVKEKKVEGRGKKDKECLDGLAKLEKFIKLNGSPHFKSFSRLREEFALLDKNTQNCILGSR